MADTILELTKKALVTPSLQNATDEKLAWAEARTLLEATATWTPENKPAVATGAKGADDTYTVTPVGPGTFKVTCVVKTIDPVTKAKSTFNDELTFNVMEIFHPTGVRLEVALSDI